MTATLTKPQAVSDEWDDINEHPDKKPSQFGAAYLPRCLHCGTRHPNQYAPWSGACGKCVWGFKCMGMKSAPKMPEQQEIFS